MGYLCNKNFSSRVDINLITQGVRSVETCLLLILAAEFFELEREKLRANAGTGARGGYSVGE